VAVHAIKRGVSFYSFQEEYFLGQLDIEGCIKASADIGALGIEIIPEQMMRGYPNITDDFYRQWHSWMDTYGTTPVASDLFIDTKKFPGRWLTVDEQVESVHRDDAGKQHLTLRGRTEKIPVSRLYAHLFRAM